MTPEGAAIAHQFISICSGLACLIYFVAGMLALHARRSDAVLEMGLRPLDAGPHLLFAAAMATLASLVFSTCSLYRVSVVVRLPAVY